MQLRKFTFQFRHFTATSPVSHFNFTLELFRAKWKWNTIPIENNYFYIMNCVADYRNYSKEKGKSSEQILKA